MSIPSIHAANAGATLIASITTIRATTLNNTRPFGWTMAPGENIDED